METLLNYQDFPNQFVIACQQQNGYDHAIRASSAHFYFPSREKHNLIVLTPVEFCQQRQTLQLS